MNPTSPRWAEITPSQFPWEQDALAFVRDRLPDYEPYRAWSNFEFLADDGSINEVDLLVLTPKGFFLVEIKSGPGIVEGDSGTWTWHREGRLLSQDNPLLLANRKAKKLASLLRRQRACERTGLPFLQPLIFLSHEAVQNRLNPGLEHAVFQRDRAGREGGDPRGIMHALASITPADRADPRRPRIDKPVAKVVARALDEAGIRPSHRARKVGDYQLDELLFEGPGYQDWSGTHAGMKGVVRRIRSYGIGRHAANAARETIERAAQREFQILEGIEHPGILRARDFRDSDLGPDRTSG